MKIKKTYKKCIKDLFFKKVLSVFLSVFMLLGMGTTVFAENGQAKITIDGSGVTTSLNDMEVKAYMVLKQVNPNETDSAKKQYDITDDFKDFFSLRDENDDVVNNTLFDGKNENVYITFRDNKLIYSSINQEGDFITIPGTKLDVIYPEADIISRITYSDGPNATANNGDIATFYTWIEKYIESKSLTDSLIDKTTDNNSIVIDVSYEGYYALMFSSVPDGISIKQGILVATNGKGDDSAKINLKAENITVTKLIKNQAHSDEEFYIGVDTPRQSTSANIGDTLNYQVDSKVPFLVDTDNLTMFTFTDTMMNQKLTGTVSIQFSENGVFDANTVTYSADLPVGDGNKAYFNNSLHENIATLSMTSYNQTGDNKQESFVIDFFPKIDNNLDENINKSVMDYSGWYIRVTYSTMLTGDAVRINDNEVTMYFENNGDKTSLIDKTKVYTYGLDIQKEFSDGRITDPNVTFQLRRTNAETSSSIPMVMDMTGSYRLATPEEINADSNKPDGDKITTANLKLNTSTGELVIRGLDVGTYWLVETETNEEDGFTTADPIKIIFLSDGEGVLSHSSTAKYNGSENETNILTISEIAPNDTITLSYGVLTVLNQKGFTLPETGGAGTLMMTVGGFALVGVACVLFVVSRKKESR